MMLSKEQKKILNTLIDKYEDSATFKGENKVKQRFRISPEKLFSRYADEREYDYFSDLNTGIRDLEKAGYITISEKGMKITEVTLCTERAGDICRELSRKPKDDVMRYLKGMLDDNRKYFEEIGSGNGVKEAVIEYISDQYDRLTKSKLPEYFSGDFSEYGDFFLLLQALCDVGDEIYVRDLSVKIFNDSKKLETIESKVRGCLYKYWEFSEKETVLEELGVVKTPSYVMVKGPVVIEMDGQSLDVGALTGDIGLSTKTLTGVTDIRVYGTRVITVENLTTFHEDDYSEKDCVIYLGGFHNTVRREFIRMLYSRNMSLDFYHFGDIDAGGFYIYEHLRKYTGIPFKILNMDKDTVQKYIRYTKPLTQNDLHRLNKLITKYESGEYNNPDSEVIIDTLKYLISNGVKLEQEAIHPLPTETWDPR